MVAGVVHCVEGIAYIAGGVITIGYTGSAKTGVRDKMIVHSGSDIGLKPSIGIRLMMQRIFGADDVETVVMIFLLCENKEI